jgi:predicted outer membrane repeat protein
VNVTITGNLAQTGGGIYCEDSSPSLDNVTITNNTSEGSGGGISCVENSSPSLENVTITDNLADERGGGIYCERSSSPILVNCISWNNSPQEVEFRDDYDPNTITIAYSDIEGGEEGIVTNNNGTVNWLEGNITADPLFFDIEMGDYHLTEDSPCIDTGASYFEYEGEVLVDLSEDEYYGAAPDMGAYESPFTSIETDEIEPIKECLSIYPNPFNPETNIVFELSAGSNVLIEIYNIKGQRLREWKIENVKCKINKVVWDGRNERGRLVSSGVYLVRLQSGKVNVMKKMMLVK